MFATLLERGGDQAEALQFQGVHAPRAVPKAEAVKEPAPKSGAAPVALAALALAALLH